MHSNTLYIYGNRDSQEAIFQYQKVETLLKNKGFSSKIAFINPNTNWAELEAKAGKILPLFLIRGTEYKYLEGKIAEYKLPLDLLPPFCETKAFCKLIGKNPENTFYFLHGNTAPQAQQIYAELEADIRRQQPASSVFYVDQKPQIADFISSITHRSEPIFISPLFFLRGKHIKQDLIANNLAKLQKIKWEVGPTILEDQEILLSFLSSLNIIKPQ